MNEELFARLLAADVPDLTVQISPHVDAIASSAHGWAREVGIAEGYTTRAILDYATYGGHTYPTADPDDLLLISQWTLLFFLWDDHLDNQPVSALPAESRQLLDELDRLLGPDRHQARTLAKRSPHAQAFCSLWDLSLRQWSSIGWRRRFLAAMRLYQECQQWELHNRRHGLMPDPLSYPLIKGHSSFSTVARTFLELLLPQPAPDSLMDSHVLRVMSAAAGDVADLAADVVSFDPTAGADDANMLTVLENALASTPQQAQDVLVALWTARFQLVDRLRDTLPGLLTDTGHGPQNITQALTWADLLLLWLGGNYGWGATTARYDARATRPHRP
ncbi:terpene synthase family protein [Streptomyces sp. WM6378]|uniref:terpene synthase family protein n=1 Tax=Streptomyces sp. WM6378 TaxID=1415557 RepID=UPI0006AE1881|nr:hypothetical protein [Streptomyces sp. WM6378]KOU36208.1 hypothetical protein ADK54_34760 [Streptomyces sp. WM6378]